jgi:hypothetical protein
MLSVVIKCFIWQTHDKPNVTNLLVLHIISGRGKDIRITSYKMETLVDEYIDCSLCLNMQGQGNSLCCLRKAASVDQVQDRATRTDWPWCYSKHKDDKGIYAWKKVSYRWEVNSSKHNTNEKGPERMS